MFKYYKLIYLILLLTFINIFINLYFNDLNYNYLNKQKLLF